MERKKLSGHLKDLWDSLKWYEVLTGALGLLILLGAFATWWFGDRTLKWAVDVAAPTCLAWGALSIILLWAQLRAANNQELAEQVWKRVMCLHQHFHDVPRLELTDAVRNYLRELGIHSPPSAYSPLTPEQAKVIEHDKGNDNRPPAKVLISRYLNDWEDFCGAISVGVIDEEYAIEMEGSRLIDAFFGYREVINIFRESRAHDGKVGAGATGAPPFVNKLYYELQQIALRWHKKRTEEWKMQQEKVAEVNRAADALRDKARELTGVPPKAKEKLETGTWGRH